MLFIFSSSILFAQTDSAVTIRIHSNYERALIFLDDLETPYLTPSLVPDVKTGKHKITLRWIDLLNRSEYVAEDTIEVTGRDSNSFRVEFKPVSVILVCNAEHTKLYLNGRLRGEGGDLVIDRIIPGTYNLRLKQGYGLTAEKQVYFPPNTSDCPPECFIFGNLNVVSEEIRDVPILINGIKTDRRVPAVFSNLIIGEYEVSAEIDGKRISRKAVVKANEENYVHLNPIEIAKELKELEAAKKVLEREKELAREAMEKEREKQEKEQAKNRKKEVAERLRSGLVLSGGFNATFCKKNAPGFGSDWGLLTFTPIKDLIFIQNEIRYISRAYELKRYTYGITRLNPVINVSYLYDFLILRKKIANDLNIFGGFGLGLNIKSDKIPYQDSDAVKYSRYKRNETAWSVGVGTDSDRDLSVELRYTESRNKYQPAHTNIHVRPRTFSFHVGYSFRSLFVK